jgi:hypothetical protein
VQLTPQNSLRKQRGPLQRRERSNYREFNKLIICAFRQSEMEQLE